MKVLSMLVISVTIKLHTTQQGNLTAHIQHKHDSIKYGCTQCVYQASDKISLRKHVDKIHDSH